LIHFFKRKGYEKVLDTMSKRPKRSAKQPKAVLVPKSEITSESNCKLCHQGETKDMTESGGLFKMTTGESTEYYHYFCLLFSSGGVQRGKDEEGLNGFLEEDIRKIVKSGETLKCDICNKTGATIPCHKKSCRKKYHFACGSLCTDPGEHVFIFRNNMYSFCYNHAPKQGKITNIVNDPTCMICLENSFVSPPPGPGPGRLLSPCCKRTLHRDCVQKLANQAGQGAMKCPGCNTKEAFFEEMERCGIYIPHADAQWEMPENSNFYGFDEMLNLYKKCDAPSCLCPKSRGRQYSRTGTEYEVITCETCGSSGVHIVCGKLDIRSPSYVCDACQPIKHTVIPDSDSDDSIDNDYIREQLIRSEERRLTLVVEKNRLIENRKRRLEKSKQEHEDKLRQIRSFFKVTGQTPGSQDTEVKVKSNPPRAMIRTQRIENLSVQDPVIISDSEDSDLSDKEAADKKSHSLHYLLKHTRYESTQSTKDSIKTENCTPKIEQVYDVVEDTNNDESDLEIIFESDQMAKRSKAIQDIKNAFREGMA